MLSHQAQGRAPWQEWHHHKNLLDGIKSKWIQWIRTNWQKYDHNISQSCTLNRCFFASCFLNLPWSADSVRHVGEPSFESLKRDLAQQFSWLHCRGMLRTVQWEFYRILKWRYPLVMTNIANWKDPPFLMGKLTISMVIVNSHVKLPEGTTQGLPLMKLLCVWRNLQGKTLQQNTWRKRRPVERVLAAWDIFRSHCVRPCCFLHIYCTRRWPMRPS